MCAGVVLFMKLILWLMYRRDNSENKSEDLKCECIVEECSDWEISDEEY